MATVRMTFEGEVPNELIDDLREEWTTDAKGYFTSLGVSVKRPDGWRWGGSMRCVAVWEPDKERMS